MSVIISSVHPLRVAGVDVGFSRDKPTTGIGWLVGNRPELKHCHFANACPQLMQGGPYDMIAIDGPVLPDGTDNATMRSVERVFSKRLFQRRCKPGMSHVRGTGTRLREAASNVANVMSDATDGSQASVVFPRVGRGAIIEAFPNVFLGVCLDDEIYAAMPKLKRGQKFWWLYKQWKAQGLVKKLQGLTPHEQISFQEVFNDTYHHEHQAALVCLLTALLTARNHFTAVGDVEGGWFFLPPWQCWKKWARNAVAANISDLNRRGANVQMFCDGKLMESI